MRTRISLPQPVPETVRSQRGPFVMGVKRFASLNPLITQRPEGSAQLLTEDLRLFPRGEVAALVSLVPIDEVAEGTLTPNSRWSVDLAGKYSDRDRNLGDVHGVERSAAGLRSFPVRPRRRRPTIGQPVQGDGIKHLVVS